MDGPGRGPLEPEKPARPARARAQFWLDRAGLAEQFSGPIGLRAVGPTDKIYRAGLLKTNGPNPARPGGPVMARFM